MAADRRAIVLWGGLLFLGLLACYHANRDVYPLADSLISMLQTESLLHEGNLSLSKTEAASVMQWRLRDDPDRTTIDLLYLDDHLRHLVDEGLLVAVAPSFYARPTTIPGEYINVFLPGAAITAVPVFGGIEFFSGPLTDRPRAFWFASKWVASLCVAASAVYVFAAALGFLSRPQAMLVACAYGLGTDVWSMSSQALWQHGPNELFLAMGVFHLTRIDRGIGHAVLCGLANAAATWCRPTGAIVVVAVGAYLAVANRRALAAYLLSGLPLAIALLGYNWHYLGGPLRFGQTDIEALALAKTGNGAIWQTPLWLGAAGLLVSPSRGLFVFSPLLLATLPGMYLIFRRDTYRTLRPLVVATVLIWCVESRHFDWWGGWSYGYRHIVDTMPLLTLLLVPVLPTMLRRRGWAGIFGLLLIWSIGVQALGALAYDFTGWNARRAYRLVESNGVTRTSFNPRDAIAWSQRPEARIEEVLLDIDAPENRGRLWSLTDNQIAYYVTHYRQARQARKAITRVLPYAVGVTLSDTYVQLAQAQLKLGRRRDAEQSLERALFYNSANRYACETWEQLCRESGDDLSAARWKARAQGLWRHPFHMFYRLPEIEVAVLFEAVERFSRADSERQSPTN
ncbi:MAG: hypothetical protein K2Y37_09390 [Pirellulales bacterium]|nr:hypothetical protein [Pirellulales bacterium]